MAQFEVPYQQIFNVLENAPYVSLARDVAELMCAVRRQLPYLFLATQPGLVLASGGLASAASTRFWNGICSPWPAPPPTGGCQQFFGGQCPVQYTIDFFRNNGSQVGATLIQGPAILGPITCLDIAFGPTNWQSGNPPARPLTYTVTVTHQTGTTSRSVDTRVATPQEDTRGFTYRISRVDGQPDGCGSTVQPIIVPPSPPGFPIIIEGRFLGQRRPVSIDLPDLEIGSWPDFDFSPEIEIEGVRARFGPASIVVEVPEGTVSAPIQIINQLEQTINESINNSTQTINETVNNSTQTINESIDNSTQTINNNTDAQIQFVAPPILETVAATAQLILLADSILGIVNDILGILNESGTCDLQPVLDAIRCYCGEEEVTYGTQQIASGSPGGTFNVPSNTIACIVSGSNFDSNSIRTQSGSGTAPSVFYWGWGSCNYFNSNGGERIPLQFANQSFPCSEGITSITVNPIYNSTCSVIAITKERNCP